jgi:hypothetical protein
MLESTPFYAVLMDLRFVFPQQLPPQFRLPSHAAVATFQTRLSEHFAVELLNRRPPIPPQEAEKRQSSAHHRG